MQAMLQFQSFPLRYSTVTFTHSLVGLLSTPLYKLSLSHSLLLLPYYIYLSPTVCVSFCVTSHDFHFFCERICYMFKHSRTFILKLCATSSPLSWIPSLYYIYNSFIYIYLLYYLFYTLEQCMNSIKKK